ncbi:MAG: phenylalanine 4-monooxygenase [Rhodobacterales bacterium]|nr:MAG: phenylalanine 4-monooxygenase [Rhodobacterales bacterium]
MAKDSSYISKEAGPDGLYPYDAKEDRVWSVLMERQMADLPGRIAPEFLDGIDMLGLKPDRVPQVRDINARLKEASGAGVEGVPAIIPPTRFFTLLSERKFPVATFIRRMEHLDYIEEPDLFHEVFGHCPMLTNPFMADFIQGFGQKALSMEKSHRWHMFRLFWFTVEFGMIDTPQGLRGYGAGIASSPAELRNATGGGARMRPFTMREALRTPYRIDIVQPVYFVIDSFEQLARTLDQDFTALIDEAKTLGDLPPLFDPA